MTKEFEFILYVKDQEKSRDFYRQLLTREPRLDVPGMTEFEIEKGVILGLMPENGIAALLNGLPHPSLGSGIPRCEIYMHFDNVISMQEKAVKLGGKIINEAQKRNWGHIVSYVADPDGHILAFASADK